MEQKLLDLYEEGDWIVSGGCKQGGDRFARKFAEKHGTVLLEFHPNYSRYGRGAPIIRNTPVADNSDMVIACVVSPEDGIDEVLKRKTGGTEDTLRKFCKRVESYKDKVFLV